VIAPEIPRSGPPTGTRRPFIRGIWRTIARGQVWHGEIRNRAKDGSCYWVDTTIVPFLTVAGKPWQYLSVRYDVTERKLAEARLREEAALTQLGRLAAVVAHEVRNPLAGLRGALQVLARRLPTEDAGREIIPPMIERIDALAATMHDLLTYARPTQPKPQRFDLKKLLEGVVASASAASKTERPVPIIGKRIARSRCSIVVPAFRRMFVRGSSSRSSPPSRAARGWACPSLSAWHTCRAGRWPSRIALVAEWSRFYSCRSTSMCRPSITGR
jgi:signal transduction histidine kinase